MGYVIVAGNPLAGLEIFGPYASEDWWIAPLERFSMEPPNAAEIIERTS